LHFTDGETNILGNVDLNESDWQKQYVGILGSGFEYVPENNDGERQAPLVTAIPAFVSDSFPEE